MISRAYVYPFSLRKESKLNELNKTPSFAYVVMERVECSSVPISMFSCKIMSPQRCVSPGTKFLHQRLFRKCWEMSFRDVIPEDAARPGK